MRKVTLSFLILLSLFVFNSCNDDPFDDLILESNLYDKGTSVDAINIKSVEVESYGINLSTGDTVNLKLIIKCDLNPNYFGEHLFKPKYKVTPEMYINNNTLNPRKEALNDNYYIYLGYSVYKDIENELLFKFHLVRDEKYPERRKIASNTIKFRVN